MAKIIRNVRDRLITQLYFIKNDQYFPECINRNEIISRLEKCIDLINACLPKDVDCFGKEGSIHLTHDEGNVFNKVYEELKRIDYDITRYSAQKNIVEIGHLLNELNCFIDEIEKRLLSIVN